MMLCAVIMYLMCSCTQTTDAPSTTDAPVVEDAYTQKEQKIFEVHDEVMPLMQDMARLHRDIAELAEIDTTNGNAAYDKALEQLNLARYAMMNWMARYESVDILRDSLTEIQMTDHLNEELRRIESVSQQMKSAIRDAQMILGESTEDSTTE